MRIGIVGYGRFGCALGALLLEAGHAYRAWDPVAEGPADGRAAKPGPTAASTSPADWAHFEGKAFEVDTPAKVRRSLPIPLDLE